MAIAALGGLWFFPDAISRLRTAGVPYAEADRSCDFAQGPCEAVFDDGVRVTLHAGPQPVPQGESVTLQVEVGGDSEPQAIEIQGAEMAMGFLRLPLEPSGTRWILHTELPACATDRMLWKADVVLDDRVAGFHLWSTR